MVIAKQAAGDGYTLWMVGTQTFIADLISATLIAPSVTEGAMDGEAFAAYVEQVLVSEPDPGTV